MFTTSKPTVDQLIDAYLKALRGQGDNKADVHRGSIYEIFGGAGAILWSRQLSTDEERFNDTLTDTADGDALTYRLQKLYGYTRPLDAPGTGSIDCVRTGSNSEILYTGTRLSVSSGQGITYFRVTADTFVPSSLKTVTVPIECLTAGNAEFSESSAKFEDTLVDTTWTIVRLTCGAGTSFEKAADARANARITLSEQRKGTASNIIKACRDVGASKVALFPSNYSGSDYGLNRIFVGDAQYNASSALLRACTFALEGWRPLGDHLQIRPMVSTPITMKVTIYLVDTPSKYNQPLLIERFKSYLIAGLNDDFSYSLDSFRASLYRSSTLVQDATFVTPSSDANVLTAGQFPNTLPKYTLSPNDIQITLKGPNV